MAGADQNVTVWATPEWLETATVWIDECLAETGVARTDPVEQPRIYPWGTVLTAPTSAGRVWFKACGVNTAREVELYPILAATVPDRVLIPIAIDHDRRWLLLPDGGQTLVPRGVAVDVVLDALRPALPRYAELQRSLTPRLNDMLAAGTPDMRPAALPGVFEDVLAQTRRYVDRHGTPNEHAAWDRVAALGPWVTEASARLAASPIPASLDHQDLHASNFLTGDGSGPVLLFDWGDSVIAHPFASMLIALGVFVDYYELTPGDPRMVSLRDAYLEPFTDLAPHADLVAELELACRLGRIARAWSWSLVAELESPDEPGEPGQFAGDHFRVLSSMLRTDHVGMGGL